MTKQEFLNQFGKNQVNEFGEIEFIDIEIQKPSEKLQIPGISKECRFEDYDNIVFVSGNTFPVKEELKKLGLKWFPARGEWGIEF